MMKKAIVGALMMGFISTTAFAGNVDTFGIGAKASALGGAYSAYAADPYALYYNPAGLSQISSTVVNVGIMALQPKLTAHDYTVEDTDISGVRFSTDTDPLYVPSLGVAYPINDRLTVGVAAYVPYGLDVEWKEDPDENPAARNCFHSWYIREAITPGFSYKINDQIAVGLGISLGMSKSGVEEVFYKYEMNLGSIKADMEDDFNYSFNAGVLYKPYDHLTFGLTYRSRTSADFDGELKVSLNDTGKALLASSETLSSMFQPLIDNPPSGKCSYDHPEQIQGGIRLVTQHNVSIEFDMVWTRWDINQEQVLKLSTEDTSTLEVLYPGLEIAYDRDWNNTKQIRFGIEWPVNDLLTLRCGYFYDPTPIPDTTFDFQWPDADKKTYSIGAGFNVNQWTIDTAVVYSVAESRRDLGGESANLNGTYDDSDTSFSAEGHLLGIGVNVGYTF